MSDPELSLIFAKEEMDRPSISGLMRKLFQ
jgi:hypothetical protein